MEQNNISWMDSFDWELFSEKRSNKISSIPLKLSINDLPILPENLPKLPKRNYLNKFFDFSSSETNKN